MIGRIAWVLCLTGLSIHTALPAQVVVDAPLSHGTLAFDAHATLGAFTGTTSAMSGRITGGASLADVTGWVETAASTLTTHNGHRDRDMAKSLDVAHYPTIRFDLAQLAVGQPSGDSVAVTARGQFRIHGTTRPDSIPGWVWVHDGTSRFRGAVTLDVKDYGVSGLSKMLGVLKMDERILVRIDVTFGT